MGKLRSNLFILGITGGVGTGKSTVSRIFEDRGFVRINADEIARFFTTKESPLREWIVKEFGQEAFPPGEDADRIRIAEIAFSNPEKKKALESAIHPLVRKRFLETLDSLPGNHLVAWEVPLLFETDSYTLCDATLCVYLSAEDAWKRVQARGGMSREDFLRRVSLQMDIEKKKSLSDFVIPNDSTREDLEKSIENILEAIQKRVNQS